MIIEITRNRYQQFNRLLNQFAESGVSPNEFGGKHLYIGD